MPALKEHNDKYTSIGELDTIFFFFTFCYSVFSTSFSYSEHVPGRSYLGVSESVGFLLGIFKPGLVVRCLLYGREGFLIIYVCLCVRQHKQINDRQIQAHFVNNCTRTNR